MKPWSCMDCISFICIYSSPVTQILSCLAPSKTQQGIQLSISIYSKGSGLDLLLTSCQWRSLHLFLHTLKHYNFKLLPPPKQAVWSTRSTLTFDVFCCFETVFGTGGENVVWTEMYNKDGTEHCKEYRYQQLTIYFTFKFSHWQLLLRIERT